MPRPAPVTMTILPSQIPDMAAHDCRMRHGLTMFVTDRSIGIDELAREAEERGFDSLWVPEHTHIPMSRRTPPPDRRRGAARQVPPLPRPVGRI